ncbi:hypothetical protein OUZ56_031472 [Daphnia magna]|uniref:Uncharacterized protein n=1 Tax=Daphnia magna TaxID=35525 RepID=A0ABQ9ZUC1_9CRUS|nr:hypothetical protein OUZ56_031472 [Daphnia magna]
MSEGVSFPRPSSPEKQCSRFFREFVCHVRIATSEAWSLLRSDRALCTSSPEGIQRESPAKKATDFARSAFPEMFGNNNPLRYKEENRETNGHEITFVHDKNSLLPLVNQMSLRSQKGRRDFQIR